MAGWFTPGQFFLVASCSAISRNQNLYGQKSIGKMPSVLTTIYKYKLKKKKEKKKKTWTCDNRIVCFQCTYSDVSLTIVLLFTYSKPGFSSYPWYWHSLPPLSSDLLRTKVKLWNNFPNQGCLYGTETVPHLWIYTTVWHSDN